MKATPQRGHDIFVSQNYDASAVPGDGDDHVFSKRKLIDGKWKALTEEQRLVYTEAAKARHDAAAAELATEEFPEFFQWSEGLT